MSTVGIHPTDNGATVTVDNGRCQGHGKCMIDCPDVFDSDDEGFAVVTMPVVPGELVDPVRRAEAACPESAISVEPR